ALPLAARRRRRGVLRLHLGGRARGVAHSVPAGHRGRHSPRGHDPVRPDDVRLRRGARGADARAAAGPPDRRRSRAARLPSPAMTKHLLALTAALAALASAGLAGASPADTPGVSSTRITLGSSGPLSGEAAAAPAVLR